MNPPLQTPLTYKELRQMQEKDGHIQATIAWPWDETGDIDHLNDQASELITGDICALEDISYKLVGCNVDTQEVYIEVTGSVENYLADLEGEQDGDGEATA